MDSTSTVTFAPGPESENRIGYVDSEKFSKVVKQLRQFCYDHGLVEVCTQTRPSILAACEQPKTLTTHSISGTEYALPQTGQMWLEYELLRHPEWKGCFTLTSSYRDEPNPIPGRHQKIFPLFELELKGDEEQMIETWTKLFEHLGFQGPFPCVEYDDVCREFESDEVDDREEGLLYKKYGPIVFVTHFPRRSNPFWNMKQLEDGRFAKIDVIFCGQETLGSAVRSCSADEMRAMFNDLEDGEYKQHLYKQFSQERVDREVDEYLEYDMFPRFGGGCGMTRLMRGLEMSGKL